MSKNEVYIRCPDCEGDGDLTNLDPVSGNVSIVGCDLCDGVGNLSESRLREKLSKAEADELMDFFHRRGQFKDIPQPVVPRFVKGFDA